MSSSDENTVLSAIGARTILNLICKLFFRFLHFFLNALILRQIDGNILGIANVRLQLLYTTILFLSREAFRRTVPKLNSIRSIQHYINLIWAVLPAGLLMTFIWLPITLYYKTDSAEKYPFYHQACVYYALAAFIELLSEPLYLLATVTLNYQINIYIEMFASTLGFTIQAFLVYRHSESALYYYGLGYIVYALLITSTYYLYFLTRTKQNRQRLFLITSLQDLMIKPTSPFVDSSVWNETTTFFKQGVWMKILTEGERYVMSLFNLISYKDQGVFDIINNLGSLLPRLIFSTLEESAYAYFRQTLSRTKTVNDQHVRDDEMLVHPRKDEPTIASSPTSTEQQTIKQNAFTFYNYLLRCVIIISFIVIIFGMPYSRFLLNLYGGTALTEGPGPLLLRLYCIYILFLAVNGITEAFSQATMSIEELETYKNRIAMFAIVYLGVFYILIQLLGVHGIIIANCLNMSARIITNSFHIYRYFRGNQWSEPFQFSLHYLFILCFTSFICFYSERWFSNSLLHFGFGSVLGLGILFLTWREEREMIHYINCIRRLNREQKKAE
ncbi:unnamed protein product [Adineta ricciae]|uniref:Protein RFT1 homolog n=1 Tax=Adineta ricciae TaxID=249248 RepID=A0A814QYY8_ADIRI|nr:unnamed protein product [Adineta ricciae]CAF1654531.1 unnamed protein product [Adineta ricciae]